MTLFMQQLVNLAVLGSVYAAVAVGFTLTLGVLRVLNMAYPTGLMVGAFGAWYAYTGLHLPYPIAFVVGALVAVVVGILIEFLTIRPLSRGSELTPLIATVGVAILLENLAALVFGPDPVPYPPSLQIAVWRLGGVVVTSQQLWTVGIAILLVVALVVLLKKTALGTKIRAVAESHSTAKMLGLNVGLVLTLTIGIASAVGGASGILISTLYDSTWAFMGFTWAVPAMAAMIIGGAESIIGGALAGFAIAAGQVFISGYVSSTWGPVAVFGLVFLTLLLRPQGLFAAKKV
jgi:branched-chain amino acid transport system permease protein